jgi:2-polyprenyl-3-methyl-5-hydroxy-6-metoxy-1,4-benzoquinol methylase
MIGCKGRRSVVERYLKDRYFLMSNTPRIHQSSLQPAQFLIDNITLLPKGHVFDVAMGTGGNGVYLAKMGFEVEGVDISPEAVSGALELAQKTGVTIRVEVADLEDKYRIRQRAYDIIICFYYLQRSLIPRIKSGLKKGGVVVYETYIVDQAKFGRPKNPDYLLEHNELLDMFRDFRCLRYREGIIEDRKAIASIIAEKV